MGGRIKIISVVGARPNFMKIAPVAEELGHEPSIAHILLHTGQHYDDQMSAAFFRDLGLPAPDINLEVGSGSHTWQTAEVMKRLEPILLEHRPELVLTVGDVNSTLAAALTAAKLCIPVAHIEAGLRSFDPGMPEEINRKLTDAVSDYLFVTEESGVRNLRNEGVPSERIFLVGNVMIDTLLRHRSLARQSPILQQLGLTSENGTIRPYGVVTLHRPSNVDQRKVLGDILEALAQLGRELPVFFPVHPRTRERIEAFGYGPFFLPGSGLIAVQPMGYLEFLSLMDRARIVLTDSGGIQEETTVLGVPCLTLRENTERPATIEHGTNQLVKLNPQDILAAARRALAGDRPGDRRPPLWDGHAAKRIVAILRDQLQISEPVRTATVNSESQTSEN